MFDQFLDTELSQHGVFQPKRESAGPKIRDFSHCYLMFVTQFAVFDLNA